MGWGGKASKPEPDVKVKHTAGCSLCGKTGQHTHAQADWRAHLDSQDWRKPKGGR